MPDLGTINSQFFISLIIILIGYLIKRAGIIKESDGEGLGKIIINVTLPSLILVKISNIDLYPDLFFLVIVCIGYSVLIAFISSKIFRREDRSARGVLIMTTLGFNIGLFAYPLIEGIFGAEGLANIAMFDVGNAFIIFGLIYILGSIFSPVFDTTKKIDYKMIIKKVSRNIPLLSYIIALGLNIGFGGFSGIFYNMFDIIAKANNGLVLLLLGVYLNFNIDKENWNRIGKVLILRYGGGIIAGLICYFLLPFDQLFKSILMISFILPIGMSVIPFVVQFKFEDKLIKLTAALTNMTIIISFGLMWLILVILNL